MAKVMIDIPDRYIDAVKGLSLVQMDNEQDVQQLERATDLLKQTVEPIEIDVTDTGVLAGDEKNRKQVYLALGALAIAQVANNNKE